MAHSNRIGSGNMYTKSHPLDEKLVKTLADSVAASIYHTILLAMGIEVIEDYKKHPEKYIAGDKVDNFFRYLLEKK